MRRRICIAVLVLLIQSCAQHTPVTLDRRCKTPIGDLELYSKLGQQPYFANVTLATAKNIRIDREPCGFRIHVGTESPDEIHAAIVLVDADGQIVEVLTRP